MQVGLGFWPSKVLLSAVELDLFSVLGERPMTGAEVGDRLSLHPRSLYDFLDALVALDLLERDGDGPLARYRNTPETGAFLDRAKPGYHGGFLDMCNTRLYGFWGNLTEGLRTGGPQNEAKDGGDLFGAIYADQARLEGFLQAMTGIQLGNFLTLLDKVDLSSVQTLCDVGGANGTFCALAAQRHPNLNATLFELPVVTPVAERHLTAMGVADRVDVVAGDFFTDDLPNADVIVMGNILHDWDLDQKQELIAKAYKALNDGGRFVAVEAIIDDARRTNAMGLMMSLNMLIETPGGFDYTGAQFDDWCTEAGFERTEVVSLAGPASAAIAYK
jgi:precorrin-6B methylase 2